MEIIQESDILEESVTELCFWFKGHHRQWGYSFACSETGFVDESQLPPEAIASLKRCQAGSVKDLESPEVLTRQVINRVPRIGRCNCGQLIYLSNFTNTCDKCGADYNSAGTLLAPRSQWGEETG